MANRYPKTDSSASLGFEAKLWLAVDTVSNNMDVADTGETIIITVYEPESEKWESDMKTRKP